MIAPVEAITIVDVRIEEDILRSGTSEMNYLHMKPSSHSKMRMSGAKLGVEY